MHCKVAEKSIFNALHCSLQGSQEGSEPASRKFCLWHIYSKVQKRGEEREKERIQVHVCVCVRESETERERMNVEHSLYNTLIRIGYNVHVYPSRRE